MTDEKLIEEMAKCMCSSYESGKGCNTCPTIWCYADECATRAFCNGYRKLPKNAVVLTRKEYERLQREAKPKPFSRFCQFYTATGELDCDGCGHYDICKNGYLVCAEKVEEAANKKTAKEVLKEVRDAMKCFEDDDDGYLLKKCEFEYFMRELAKRCGVEVEEL